MLQQLAPDLWVLDEPRTMLGIEIGARMTVVRLRNGSLWLHSPLAPSREKCRALDALGPVACLVAPNICHYSDLQGMHVAYPDARIWGAPRPPRRCKHLKSLSFEAELNDLAPPIWADDFDQSLFRASALMKEIVFCHRASRTLILTDLIAPLGQDSPPFTRYMARVSDVFGADAPQPPERLSLRDKSAARESLERVLSWDFERIIFVHGNIVPSGGKDALREAFSWLLKTT